MACDAWEHVLYSPSRPKSQPWGAAQMCHDCVMQVVAAGSPQQVADAMRDAEQYKEPLMERAVLVVPLPIYEGEAAAPEPDTDASTSDSRAEQTKEDLR